MEILYHGDTARLGSRLPGLPDGNLSGQGLGPDVPEYAAAAVGGKVPGRGRDLVTRRPAALHLYRQHFPGDLAHVEAAQQKMESGSIRPGFSFHRMLPALSSNGSGGLP